MSETGVRLMEKKQAENASVRHGTLDSKQLHENQLMVIATHLCTPSDDFYQVVDFLNRNLKDKEVIFGLSKSPDEDGKMLLTLYRS